jgi:AraC-like DNA-binding protein
MTFDYGAEAPPSEFVNPPTLVRCILFKEATGQTPFQFVTHARMEEGKRLLRRTCLPISEIAQRVGYRARRSRLTLNS